MPSPTRRYYSSTAVAGTLTATLTSSATTMVVSTITGWPGSFPYTVIIGEDTASEELVTVTAGSSTTLTVTRGVGGTSGQAHGIGETVRHGVYSQDFEDGSAHYAASTAVHGVAGSVVGTSDTQTLTNKTISGSSNTFSSVPSSAVVGLDTHTGSTTAHGATGAVVGTTNTQTLTNKTISGASNTITNVPNSAIGLTSSPVGVDDTQTLTNKTLTSPTLTTPTISSTGFANANHAHSGSTSGGKLLQANTHESVDTDVSTSSIHHTLGTGQYQAAPGSHTHTQTTNPVVKIASATNQSIANNTTTTVDFTSTEFNSSEWSLFSIDLVNNRVVAPSNGYYLLTAFVAWEPDADGRRTLWFYTGPSGTQVLSEPSVSSSVSGTYSEQQIHTVIQYLNSGDYIQLRANHVAGASINITDARLSAALLSV